MARQQGPNRRPIFDHFCSVVQEHFDCVHNFIHISSCAKLILAYLFVLDAKKIFRVGTVVLLGPVWQDGMLW